MQPLVSFIMPAYNAEKFIGEAIESVISQTYENWELIIVDDASTDNTRAIITQYLDERIKLLVNEVNKGIAATTNRAIKESKGEYIALLDDDDVAESQRASWQVDFLEKNLDIDVLGGRTTYIDERGEVLFYGDMPRKNPKYIKAVLLFNCMDFMNSTLMIRRSFIERYQLYYQENCYGMQDYFFYIQSSKAGNITTIDRFLLKHRYHENNATKINLEKHKIERARKHAEFQRYSLTKSGFQLSDEEYNVIHKCFSEKNASCDTIEEFYKLYEILKKILKQAKDMELDFLKELEHLCKVKLSKMLIKMDIFNEGNL